MKNLIVLSLIFIALIFSGCATIYESPDINERISQHKVIAILPFDAAIKYGELSFENNSDRIEEEQEIMGLYFQEQMYLRFLRYVHEYNIEFQDISKTNTLLKQNDIVYYNINDYTKEELAKILNVDAVVSGKIFTNKPISTGAAIALELLTKEEQVTNEVNVNVSLYDGKDSKLLYKYDHTYEGGIGSSQEELSKSMMRSIAKNFPYRKK